MATTGILVEPFYDNVVYADGRQKLLWEDPNNSLTATIRNAAYLYDDFNQNTPSLAQSSNNLAFYYNPWGGSHGFHNDAGNAAHPVGNDPWNYDIDKTTNNWDGRTGGIHIDRWQKRFETIESLVEQYGTFNARVEGVTDLTAD